MVYYDSVTEGRGAKDGSGREAISVYRRLEGE